MTFGRVNRVTVGSWSLFIRVRDLKQRIKSKLKITSRVILESSGFETGYRLGGSWQPILSHFQSSHPNIIPSKHHPIQRTMTDADPWDAFGDDSDNDDEEHNAHVQSGITFLTQHFCKHNPQIGLDKRIVAIGTEDKDDWGDALTQRGIQILLPTTTTTISDTVTASDNLAFCDAAIVTGDDYSIIKHVVPGGCLLLLTRSNDTPAALLMTKQLHTAVWNVSDAQLLLEEDDGMKLWAITRWACPINNLSCPWKNSKTNHKSLHEELQLLQKATMTRSAHEMNNSKQDESNKLSPHTISQAVHALSEFGYCIVRHSLDPIKCRAWGNAILEDLRDAAKILLERDQIDLYHPHESQQDAQSYRELSMREDLRMDLRDGPRIRRLRAQERNDCGLSVSEKHDSTTIISSSSTNNSSSNSSSSSSCLSFHPDVLQIVQQTMNPTNPTLAKGNFGRYNFKGSGPDGSPQPLRVGPMGGIVSLPNSADQAIHADTPHLFETHDCLPAHYINAFCLGTDDIVCQTDNNGMSTGATPVGGTAFVHASHKLSFTASLKEDWSVTTEPRVLQNLVRPSLQNGDLILFDCRILHFGLANTSKDVERPLLYSNMTQAWFHDPKNWNDRETIFPTS